MRNPVCRGQGKRGSRYAETRIGVRDPGLESKTLRPRKVRTGLATFFQKREAEEKAYLSTSGSHTAEAVAGARLTVIVAAL